MTRNTPLTLRLGGASLSLLIAVAVYLLARIYPPETLAPFQSAEISLATHTEVFGSAPSFFYTLALGLFISALYIVTEQSKGTLPVMDWFSFMPGVVSAPGCCTARILVAFHDPI